MFYFGFPLNTVSNIMHLFASSIPAGSTMYVQSSAHQTSYNYFWWGQGAKIVNIFKNRVDMFLFANLFKKFSTGILNSVWAQCKLFHIPKSKFFGLLSEEMTFILFLKHFPHKYVNVQGPGVVGNSDMYHMENSLSPCINISFYLLTE